MKLNALNDTKVRATLFLNIKCSVFFDLLYNHNMLKISLLLYSNQVLKSIQGHHPKLTALSLQGYGDFMLLAGNIIGSMHELQQLSIAHCQPEDILEFNRESCLQNLWYVQ